MRAGRDYRDDKQMHCFITERGTNKEEKKESIQMFQNVLKSTSEVVTTDCVDVKHPWEELRVDVKHTHLKGQTSVCGTPSVRSWCASVCDSGIQNNEMLRNLFDRRATFIKRNWSRDFFWSSSSDLTDADLAAIEDM